MAAHHDTDTDSDRATSRLLSGRGRMSRPEHEEIFAAVLRETETQAESDPVSRWPWWSAGLLAAAAALLIAWWSSRDAIPEEPDPFAVRGEAGIQLEVRCEPTCEPGAHVSFDVANPGVHTHVAVFSFREDGVVIWYAPETADARSVAVPASGGLLPFQVELDASHPPGTYTVVAAFSAMALDRGAIRSAYEARPQGIEFVERVLEVRKGL